MEKVIYDFKDLGLASYLILNGNQYKGVNVKYVKRFNEFKIFIRIEGYKEQINSMKMFYEDNKIQILKSKTMSNKIDELYELVERSLKNKEENTLQS